MFSCQPEVGLQMSGNKVAIKRNNFGSSGFTIVELMIALSVLSMILLISTMLMTGIGHMYLKGVNQATIQDANRNISGDVESVLQFGGGAPTHYTCNDGSDPQGNMTCYSNKTPGSPTVYSFCINSTRYSYILNKELGDDAPGYTGVKHVMWKDKTNDDPDCTPLDITQDGTPAGSDPSGFEMVPVHGRLVRFKVYENPKDSNIYTVDIVMAYGDSDLLSIDTSTGDAHCNGGAGSQFCGFSKHLTSVKRRIE